MTANISDDQNRESRQNVLVEVIAIPVTKSQRDRYYQLANYIKDIRYKYPDKKPKKITQLAREYMDEMLDQTETWLKQHGYKAPDDRQAG